ncbi:DinB family protein [Maribacter sp. X9]|uniref:DinB family protein n=1 Tax=Maribacter sp. X9 TaxID=3402159 RepID=UPI003AF34EC1
MRKKDLKKDEYGHFYTTYLNMMDSDEEIVECLRDERESFLEFAKSLSQEQLQHRYAKGKWTVAELLIHIIDTERIFLYRAFRFSRNDMTPLPGFEQDGYVLESDSEKRTKESIIEEFINVREVTLNMFELISEEKLTRVGMASGMPWSVGAIGFVISGHQRHHFKILRERYFLN